jgi:1,4-dihydroxy-2-naphthoyl-CoA hydrolase
VTDDPRTPTGLSALVGSTDPDLLGNFVSFLGLEFTELSADRVVAVWNVDARLHQPYGILHGGVHCSVVETLASVGAAQWVSERDETAKVVGVNNNTDFFRAVRKGPMTSTATPLHRGRSQQLWLVETYADADGSLSARGQVRLQNLYAPA